MKPLLGANNSSTARRIQKWRARDHLDFESLTAENILQCPYFWNLYQSQADSFYSFYVDTEESLQRRHHALCELAGCAAAQLRDSTANFLENQYYTRRHTSSGYHHSNSLNSSVSAGYPYGNSTDDSSSTTSLIQLREEAILLRQFVHAISDEIVKLLRAYDDSHGSDVFQIELSDLKETHDFLDGSQLTSLISRIDEDIAKWKNVNTKANMSKRMSLMVRNGRMKTNRRNSVVLLQSVVGTTMDDNDELPQQSQSQAISPMVHLNTNDTHRRNANQMQLKGRGVGRRISSKFMRFWSGR